MQCNISTLYFAGHVGPFRLYPAAAYSIVVATSPDKLAMPGWRNNIVTMAPNMPDEQAVTALCEVITANRRAILNFADHTTFKAWQLLLAQVLV